MGKGKENERPVQRWGPERKPTIGGITLYIAFLLCLTLTYGPYFGGSEVGMWLMGVLGAGSLAFLMGLSDDVYETRPFLKLTVQAVCGVILAVSGTAFQLPAPQWLEFLLTILWVILIMNAFNMIDNMDGIAGGIALCILFLALLMARDEAGRSLEFLLIGMSAGVLGFLYHNLHPSRIFLGDAGTQFLGLFLAAIGLRLFWASGSSEGEAFGLLEKGMLFLLPFWSFLADTFTVFVLRILRGGSPLVGGKDHTTHSISYRGVSERLVNLIFVLWTLLNCANFYIVTTVKGPFGALIPALFAYILITFAIVFLIAYRAGEKEGEK